MPAGFHRRSSTRPVAATALALPILAAALAAQTPGRAAPPAAAAPPAPATFDTARLTGLRYRMIGPARGGRVTAVAGVPSEPRTFYFGATGGGVWKTTDAGATWRNVSDGFFTEGSIGAVEVASSDPRVVYVGTGSDGIRSNVSIGRGVYRSGDAGKTWAKAGLERAGQIGAVRVHPADPNTAYAAALGNPFARNPERGVYRTRDGGKTWQRVLYVSDSTGAVDVELEPGNPRVLYASMWRAERKPWTIVSGAREGGVYRSADGGDTWTRLAGGLPAGLVGKSNVAVTAADPRRVYALVEAKPGGGLYRSDDAGATWALASGDPRLITRPFYYTTITADPTNADVVYVGSEGYYRSTDGGRTFATMATPHGDNHDLWINPRDGRVMIQSNDGGANVSLDGGASWSTQYNQPTAEIYQVAVDDQVPYRVYGAQQDNSTLIVPSLPPNASAPDDPVQLWRAGPGCETGPIVPNTAAPDTVYGSCKGQFSRMSLRTGQEKQYWVGAQSLYGNPGKALTYRFQRVSPLATSPHDPRTLYYGSQYLHRTRDEGATWERISPDLTAADPRYQGIVSGGPITIDVTGEEYYSTLYAVAESPLEAGVIWAGANDGPISVTRDGGKTWARVTPKGLPPGGRVQTVEPSPHRRGSAYAAVLRYQLGDFRPYVYRTEDYGKTWTRLTTGTNGVPNDEPTRVVREDPDRPGLLYLGTEFGMYVSFDNGARWRPFQLNLPHVPVTDIKVAHQDLVLSTQGRAFWILDDVTPLHALSDAVTAGAAAHLFAPRPAYRMRYATGFGGAESARRSSGDPEYIAPGAVIDYWLPAGADPGALSLEVVDSSGAVVRAFSGAAAGERAQPPAEPGMRAPALERVGTPRLPAAPGLNRFVWDLAYPGPWDANPARSGRNGPLAVPGRYTVRLTAGGQTTTQPLVVRADPRVTADGVTAGDLAEQLAHNLRVRDLVSEANRAVGRLRAAQRDGGADSARLAAVERALVTPPVRYSQPGLQAHISYLYGLTTQADQKVGRDAVERLAELRAALDREVAALTAALAPRPRASAAPAARR